MTGESNCWWLGINNHTDRQGSERVVLFPEIAPFLFGERRSFEWPTRGQKRSCYSAMNVGDRVLLWMGHNPQGQDEWGILGTGRVGSILRVPGAGSPAAIELVDPVRFLRPLTPHTPGADARGPEARTSTSELLWEVFGDEFEPLFDVFTRLGYFTRPRRSIVTVFPVGDSEFHRLMAAAERKAA